MSLNNTREFYFWSFHFKNNWKTVLSLPIPSLERGSIHNPPLMALSRANLFCPDPWPVSLWLLVLTAPPMWTVWRNRLHQWSSSLFPVYLQNHFERLCAPSHFSSLLQEVSKIEFLVCWTLNCYSWFLSYKCFNVYYTVFKNTYYICKLIKKESP